MRRFYLVLLLAAGAVVLALFIGANFLLDLLCQQLLVLVPRYSHEVGIEVLDANYSRVTFSSIRSITWYGVHGRIRPRFQGEFTAQKYFDLTADEIRVETLDFSFQQFRIAAKNATIKFTRGATAALLNENDVLPGGSQIGTIEATSFNGVFAINIRNPFPALKAIIEQLKELLSKGYVKGNILFDGRYTMLVTDTEEQWIGTRVAPIKGSSAIFLNERDLQDLRRFFKVLTDQEIMLIGTHPHWATALVRTKYYCERQAEAAARADSALPADAYLQIYWSYQLAKQFGAHFAKLFTDAHEIGDLTKSEAEHRMAYTNNQVGREAAKQGLEETELINLAKTDKHVIRRAH